MVQIIMDVNIFLDIFIILFLFLFYLFILLIKLHPPCGEFHKSILLNHKYFFCPTDASSQVCYIIISLSCTYHDDRILENNHLHLQFTLVNDFWDSFTAIEKLRAWESRENKEKNNAESKYLIYHSSLRWPAVITNRGQKTKDCYSEKYIIMTYEWLMWETKHGFN